MDLLFYPLDTLKTRLQSSQGFVNSGGLKGVYRGVGSVLIGSAPGGECVCLLLSLSLLRSGLLGPDAFAPTLEVES